MAGQAAIIEQALRNEKPSSASGPLAAVEALVTEHSGMVFRIAWSILRNHHDAEDAVQECFLRALKYGKDLAHVRAPKTWLASIAWRAALDRRRNSAETSLQDDSSGQALLESLPADAPSIEDQLAGRQMRQLLESMIATLPAELRQPLELSTVSELNSSEIAEIMGIPEGSVRTRLLRARKLLKEKLTAYMENRHG